MIQQGLAQYLRIFDDAGTRYRWQNRYHGQAVTWEGASWIHVPFSAGGMVAGVSGDETGITIEAPATSLVVTAFEDALRLGHLLELRQYRLDPFAVTQPPSSQVLMASFLGQVVGGSATLIQVRFQLGSALAPIGRQVPPRSLTTRIMGVGVRA